MTTPINMLAIDLAKGSFQVCAIGQDGACVDAPLRVPRDDGHRFHGMMGTDSTRSWAVIPRDRGQV